MQTLRLRRRLLTTTALVAAGALVAASPAAANPTGGNVVAGQAAISGQSSNSVAIHQSSERAIIDWSAFGVGAGQQVQFAQPNAQAVTLNRVTGATQSEIDGALKANGSVFLVNPNGVVFGKGAQVDVAGLVATTADIANADFMAGTYRFDRPSTVVDAVVVNAGRITVAQGGLAALVGPTVANKGVISAKLGAVVLGGHATFTVDLMGDGLLAFDTGVAAPAAAASVSNSGTIVADGGRVLMDAAAAADALHGVVDMSGVVEARAVGVKNGVIVLTSGADGATTVSGTLDVSSSSGMGGSAKALGGTVSLASTATINASGAAGGGQVAVGGDFHGAGLDLDAQTTSVASGAVIKADATRTGDGGQARSRCGRMGKPPLTA